MVRNQALTGDAAAAAVGLYVRLGNRGARFDRRAVARAALSGLGRAHLTAALRRPAALLRASRPRAVRPVARPRARRPGASGRVGTSPGRPGPASDRGWAWR